MNESQVAHYKTVTWDKVRNLPPDDQIEHEKQALKKAWT